MRYMTTQYTIEDYTADKAFVEKSKALPDHSPEAMLEIMIKSNSGSRLLFVNHFGILRTPKGCVPLHDAYNMLKFDKYLQHRITQKNGSIPEGEVRELMSEVREEISERVAEVFGGRCNGARTRVERYDKKQNSLKLVKPAAESIPAAVAQIPETPTFPVQRYLFA